MKKVLIIIAPMGFGPASKGLFIAEKLSLFTELTISTMGDAYDFIAKFAPSGVTCLRGGITSQFTFTQISCFDFIISINNVPAVVELTRVGLGNRVILFDDLLQWRQEKTKISLHNPILAYLVQDFPGVGQCTCTCQAQYIHLVSPIIWSSNRKLVQNMPKNGITLCFGGITSVLVGWNDVKILIKSLIMSTYEICKTIGIPLTVIGNEHLCELDLINDDFLKILGMVDPITSYELIANSQLLMTTPGIGTVYEGIGTSTPIMLMPPINSTQLQQYQVFVNSGFSHILQGCPILQQLYEIENSPWEQQATLCVNWLQQQIDELVILIRQSILAIYNEHNELKTKDIVIKQNNLFNNLSKLDINEILYKLIN